MLKLADSNVQFTTLYKRPHITGGGPRAGRPASAPLSLLVDYIHRYNVGIDDHHMRLLSLTREEALLRYRINYDFNKNNDDDDGGDDVGADGDDEIDGRSTV